MTAERIAEVHRAKCERILAIEDKRRRESEVRVTAQERRELLDALRHHGDGLPLFAKAERLERRLRSTHQKIAAGLRGER